MPNEKDGPTHWKTICFPIRPSKKPVRFCGHILRFELFKLSESLICAYLQYVSFVYICIVLFTLCHSFLSIIIILP